jgi:hypothetical protein
MAQFCASSRRTIGRRDPYNFATGIAGELYHKEVEPAQVGELVELLVWSELNAIDGGRPRRGSFRLGLGVYRSVKSGLTNAGPRRSC